MRGPQKVHQMRVGKERWGKVRRGEARHRVENPAKQEFVLAENRGPTYDHSCHNPIAQNYFVLYF
jgi:hypothetical protein